MPEEVRPRCEVVHEIRYGNPRDEILKVAKEQNADLILTGARGAGSSGAPWGSVSSAVVRDGRYPVLVVAEEAATGRSGELPPVTQVMPAQERDVPSRIGQRWAGWRARLHEIIFEADTPMGKAFDVALLWAIALSVLAVILESVEGIRRDYGSALRTMEWVFTILFTVEYGLRLACVERPPRYARSFFGVVDVLAILPTYLSLVVGGAQSLLVIRALRLLRLFRIFKLARYVGQVQTLKAAMWASIPKITVFLGDRADAGADRRNADVLDRGESGRVLRASRRASTGRS